MRVPLSWLREYVDLPADVDRPTSWPTGSCALGLEVEASTRPAPTPGPLVVGRVLEFDVEEQSNGKTIRWCQVDVGETRRRPPRHRLRRAQLLRRRQGRRGAAGRRAARRLPDRGPQDLRPRVGRHDLLGARARPRRRPRRHPRARDADDRRARHRRDRRCSACATTCVEIDVTPDRGYALSMRGVAREARTRHGAAFRDPAATLPCRRSRGDGYPVARRRRRRLRPSSSRCDGHGVDPTAPTPRGWPAGVQLAGMRPISLAVDITNYVMLELGQPIHGYDLDKLHGRHHRAPGDAGREAGTLDGTMRTLDPEDLLITDDSRPDRPGRRDGRRDTEMSAATTTCVIEAAHFDPVTIARTARRHKLPSEASRGSSAASTRRSPSSPRAASPTCWSSTAAGDRADGDRRRRAGAARADHDARPTCRPGSAGFDDRRRPPSSRALRRSAATVDASTTDRLGRDAAAVAPRPHRPVRPGRRGRPHRRLRQGAAVLPAHRPAAA